MVWVETRQRECATTLMFGGVSPQFRRYRALKAKLQRKLAETKETI